MQKCLYSLLAALLTLSLGFSTPTTASDNGQLLSEIFSQIEKQTIKDYYHGRYGRTADEEGRHKGKKHKGKKGLPPGLAKRDRLPPGLEKQLQRNGHLPPGLEKRQLPEGLERLLPRRHDGRERVLVDNDVLLIETATGLILDILEDVF
ncbi:MAG: hypothetical protein OQL28_13885 [Sedimenticola sp.]|nr:hypothetical protein [Sedimenticola sp.]